MKRIVLLRLGHRPERDKRITTHVGLTARMLGAEGMLLASDDPGIMQSLEDVVRRWVVTFTLKITSTLSKKSENGKKKAEKSAIFPCTGLICQMLLKNSKYVTSS